MKSETITSCVLCQGKACLKKEDLPGYQEPATFSIYDCPDCGTSFSLPQPDDTNRIYEIIYENASIIPGYDRYWKYAESVIKETEPLSYLADIEDTYWGVCESLNRIVKDKQSVKILEVGSGLGYLTYSLNKAGYNATGIDISHTAVSMANQKYGNYYVSGDIYDYVGEKEGCFDVVILTEVIEHIKEPEGFLRVLLKLLKPDGHIILTTPNKSIFPNDIVWYTDLPPVHYWWFSEKSVHFLANKLNLKAEFIDFRRYYKKHMFQYDLVEMRKDQLIKPALDSNGSVKIYNMERPTGFKTSVLKIPFVKSINSMFKELSDPNIVTCRAKGAVICAIIKKI